MLLKRAILVAAVLAISPAVGDETVVSNKPEHLSRRVFVGSDALMPVDGNFLVAIEPKLDGSGKVYVPTTIGEAFSTMHELFPHWVLGALVRPPPSNDQDCSVLLNGLDVGAYIMYWLDVNWRLEVGSTPLHTSLVKAGVPRGSMRDALYGGFCDFVRTGRVEAGLAVIGRYRK